MDMLFASAGPKLSAPMLRLVSLSQSLCQIANACYSHLGMRELECMKPWKKNSGFSETSCCNYQRSVSRDSTQGACYCWRKDVND
jgi:hypothetical protein